MRKFMMLGALVAVVVAALAVPALAQTNRDFSRGDQEEFAKNYVDYLEDFYGLPNGALENFYRLDGLDNQWGENGRSDEDNRDNPWWGDERNDHDWWNDWRHDDERDNDRNKEEVVPAVSQSFEQQAQSGDVNQSFDVSNTGDNSNQCVGIQGVGNTGNSQNVIDLIQYGSEADDFEFEEVGSDITVSPTNTTECTSEVNQAASATG